MPGTIDLSNYGKINVDGSAIVPSQSTVLASQLTGAPGYDRSGATASDAALQDALNRASGFSTPLVVVPAGDTLKLSVGGVTIPAGVELQINGLIDASSCSIGTTMFTASGAATAAQALTANCPQGQRFCQVVGGSPADNTYIKLQSSALWNAGMPLNMPNGGNQPIGEVVLVRVPTATVKTAVTAGDTTISLNNTQGDARTSYFPIGAPITINGVDSITFTGVSVSTSTITLSGCSGVASSHSVGAGVTLGNGYVAFAGPTVGGPYNTADTAAIVPVTYIDSPALTGTGTLLAGGPALAHIGVVFSMCRGPRLSRELSLVNFADTAVYFRDCIDVSTSSPRVRGGRSSSNDFYGMLFVACENVTMQGGEFRDVRHSVSSGNPLVNGIARRITVDGAHAVYTTASSFESHVGGEDFAFINCHSTDSLDNGISFRCPSGRVENFLCRRPATRGIWLRNQTTQPSRYVITGFDISDSGDNGIALRPDTGTFPVLQGTISSATAAPFTITVDSTSQPNGFPASGGTIIVGETDGILAEQMTYDTLTPTTFHVTARAQNGTSAQNFANGSPIMIGSTGTGALTDSVEISNGKILRAGAISIGVYTADNYRFQGVKIDNVTIKDQVFVGEAVQILNADHCDINVTVLGHPATSKMVRLINCTNCTVRLNGKFVSQSTGVGVSLESGCSKIEVVMPNLENAGTGVLADSTCTNCTAITGNGLKGSTTRVSFPAGKGHYWNQSPRQLLVPNVEVAGTSTQPLVAGTVYIGRLNVDQPTTFAGLANLIVTTASTSAADTVEVAVLDEFLNVTPLHTTGAVAGKLGTTTGLKTLSFTDSNWELERGVYWIAVYAPVISTSCSLDCITMSTTAAGAPWSTGTAAQKRLLIGNVYGGGAGSIISGQPAISGANSSAFCPIVGLE